MDTLLLLALKRPGLGPDHRADRASASRSFSALPRTSSTIAHGDFLSWSAPCWPGASLEATGNFLDRLHRCTAHLSAARRADPGRGHSTHSRRLRRCRSSQTFGLSLILQEAVRMTFGRDTAPGSCRRFPAPCRCSGSSTKSIGCLAAMLSLAALAAFFIFLQHTKLGTWMRRGAA